MPPDAIDGWRWFDPPHEDGRDGRDGAEDQAVAQAAALARAAARTFAAPEGRAVLDHLIDLTQRRALGPDAPVAALRHLEGQRQLVAYLAALAARGRAG